MRSAGRTSTHDRINNPETLDFWAAELLQHHIGPDPLKPDMLTIRRHERGGWGLALVLDGWYRCHEEALEMTQLWRRDLTKVRGLLDGAARSDPAGLKFLVGTLLTHQTGRTTLHPDITVVTPAANPDSHGIALVIDGWYTYREDAWRGVEEWRSVLRDAAALLAAALAVES